jgi:hypothetical protein
VAPEFGGTRPSTAFNIGRTRRRRLQPTSATTLLPAFLCLAALLCLPALQGCSGSGTGDSGGETGLEPSAYVAHVAALAVATEEGLTGDAALARAAELGGGEYSREEIETFAGIMRERPREWLELERSVDVRIRELRDGASGTPTRP